MKKFSEEMKAVILVVCLMGFIGSNFLAPVRGYAEEKKAVKAEPITLTAVSFQALSMPKAKIVLKIIDTINERAKGQLNIKVIGAEEVIPSAGQGMAVKRGVVDMAWVAASYYKGLVPETVFVEVSRITGEEERQTGFHNLMVEIHKKAGLYYLGRVESRTTASFYMESKKSTSTPSDLTGRRIGSGSTKAWPKALGMTLVIVPFAESYTAMDRGLIDVIFKPLDTLVGLAIPETAKYVIDHPFYVANSVFIMNLDKWNKLPPHLQSLIRDTYFEATANMVPPMLDEIEKHGRQKMLDAKVSFIKYSPANAKWFLDTIYKFDIEQYVKECPQNGPRLVELMTK